ncbi:MAG: response regulator transcription factor [Candidatus Aminicenantes bacterium]|nr:response regulator transcription factor [Candidatus Aminicenantes bacterium]
MKVFIVDDSSVVRDRLRLMLSEIKKVDIVGEADNVVVALRMIREIPSELIILDIRLKGGNGFDLLKLIKKSFSHMKVIMLTNYPYAQYRRRALEMGADYFFDKSTEFERVVEVAKFLTNNSLDRKLMEKDKNEG